MARLGLRATNRFLERYGFSVRRNGLAYFNPEIILPAAQASGMSLCDYLEKNDVGGVGVRRDKVIERLTQLGFLTPCDAVLEIGPGTGIFMEKTLEICRPSTYEVYETSPGWTSYLASRFSENAALLIRNADGFSLGHTASSSVDLILAHGVFVYLPLMKIVGYLEECVRVCRPGALIAFDCFLESSFGLNVIDAWRRDKHEYDFPVVISASLLKAIAARSQLELAGSFSVNYHSSESTYLIYRKTA